MRFYKALFLAKLPEMIIPPQLTPGSRVAIVAPAGKLTKGSIDGTCEILASWGLMVEIAEHVYDQHGYFSSNDANRLADIQKAFDDQGLSAIWCARGGYGVTRIIDKIDITVQQKMPRWLIGFSDITALQLKLERFGIASIHGDVGTTLGRDQEALAAHYDLLFNGENRIPGGESFRNGVVEAELIGGNLSLLCDSLGTPYELNTKGKILFIEEIGEPTYRVDRMLQQLLRAGKLNELAGLVIGHFTDITDSTDVFGQDYQACIKDIVKDFDFPVAFNLPIGHEPRNYPLVNGGRYYFAADSSSVKLEFLS